MNWTGGNLSRVPKGAGKDVVQRQKAHFAKARSRRISGANEGVRETVTQIVPPYADTIDHKKDQAFREQILDVAQTESAPMNQTEGMARCRRERRSRRYCDWESGHLGDTQQDLSEHNPGMTLEAQRLRLLHNPDWLGLKSSKRNLLVDEEPSSTYARAVSPSSSSDDMQPYAREKRDCWSQVARTDPTTRNVRQDGVDEHIYARAVQRKLVETSSPEFEQMYNVTQATATGTARRVPSQRLSLQSNRRHLLSQRSRTPPGRSMVTESFSPRDSDLGNQNCTMVDHDIRHNVSPGIPTPHGQKDMAEAYAAPKLGHDTETQSLPFPSLGRNMSRKVSNRLRDQPMKMPHAREATSVDKRQADIAHGTAAESDVMADHGVINAAQGSDCTDLQRVDTSEDLWRSFIFGP